MKQTSQLDRLLRFAQRTGDRLIITDSEGKDPVVILSLNEYEELLGGRPKLTGRRQVAAAPAEPLINDDELDIEALNAVAAEALDQAMGDEPDVVPVQPSEAEEDRPERQRKGQVRSEPSEVNEEQFYLEPI